MKSIRKGLYTASTVAMATAAAATYYVLVKQPNDTKARLKRAIVQFRNKTAHIGSPGTTSKLGLIKKLATIRCKKKGETAQP